MSPSVSIWCPESLVSPALSLAPSVSSSFSVSLPRSLYLQQLPTFLPVARCLKLFPSVSSEGLVSLGCPHPHKCGLKRMCTEMCWSKACGIYSLALYCSTRFAPFKDLEPPFLVYRRNDGHQQWRHWIAQYQHQWRASCKFILLEIFFLKFINFVVDEGM